MKKKGDFDNSYEILKENGTEKFSNIYKSITGKEYEPYNIYVDKKMKYRVLSIDTTLLSYRAGDGDSGKLKVCNSKLSEYDKEMQDDEYFNVVIMHHGIDYFEPSDEKKFEYWAEEHGVDVIFNGHSHRAAVKTLDYIERDIKQFTAGGIILDNFAIPSFYICEFEPSIANLKLSLYKYSDSNEKWVKNNSDIRRFVDGEYNYILSRHKKMLESENQLSSYEMLEKVICNLNDIYIKRFKSEKIYSVRETGYKTFNSAEIMRSLVDTGVDVATAADITERVVKSIVDKQDIYGKYETPTLNVLKDYVFKEILRTNRGESDFDICCLASRYGRRYNSSKPMCYKRNDEKYEITLAYICDEILKKSIDAITAHEGYYNKILTKELHLMSECIYDFLKNMGVVEIREDALLSLVSEYITQKPHPWVVGENDNEIYNYNIETGLHHIGILQSGQGEQTLAQVESTYHLCASLLLRYDKVVGCSETSPLRIIRQSLNTYDRTGEEKTDCPMFYYMVIQLKEDLRIRGISFGDFRNIIDTIYESVVINHLVSETNTKNALIELAGIINKLSKPVVLPEPKNPYEEIARKFSRGTGFIVKNPLMDLSNCFWLEPNWERRLERVYNLGSQILVCVVDKNREAIVTDEIKKYFSSQTTGKGFRDVVFVYVDGTSFTPDKREFIRNGLKPISIRCIFLTLNEEKNNNSVDFRNRLFETLKISKYSCV